MDIFHDLVISPSQSCGFHREIILLSPSVLMSKHSVCFRPPLLFPFSSRFVPLTFLYTFLFSLPTSHVYWFHFRLCLEVLHLFLWKTFLFSYVTHSNIIKMEIFFLVPFHTLEAGGSSHLKSNWKACFLLFLFFCLSQVDWMALTWETTSISVKNETCCFEIFECAGRSGAKVIFRVTGLAFASPRLVTLADFKLFLYLGLVYWVYSFPL